MGEAIKPSPDRRSSGFKRCGIYDYLHYVSSRTWNCDKNYPLAAEGTPFLDETGCLKLIEANQDDLVTMFESEERKLEIGGGIILADRNQSV